MSIIQPPWDATFGHTGAACVDASVSHLPHSQNNTRWTFYALPTTKRPPTGFPVYLFFSPWITGPAHNPTSCGDGWSPYPTPTPACEALLHQDECVPAGHHDNDGMARCYACVKAIERNASSDWRKAGCTSREAELWCHFDGHSPEAPSASRPVFQPPATTLDGVFFPNGSYNPRSPQTRSFVPLSGAMWQHRLLQHLVANGIAVLWLNPYSVDLWEWYDEPTWQNGLDKPFLTKLFAEVASGRFAGLGPNALDLSRLLVAGYSVGSQMTSWMIQLHATGQLAAMSGASIAAAVMFAGGSYQCYQAPPFALAQCAACNVSRACRTLGCSNTIAAAGKTPCCNYCCPANFTEAHYAEHPEAYARHPPTFLVQHSTLDENADTCAARNYHRTMVAHGGRSTLMLIPPRLERCYCVGSPGDPAAAGSPYAQHCSDFLPGQPPGGGEDLSTERCIAHTMGFADVVLPLTEFLVEVSDTTWWGWLSRAVSNLRAAALTSVRM